MLPRKVVAVLFCILLKANFCRILKAEQCNDVCVECLPAHIDVRLGGNVIRNDASKALLFSFSRLNADACQAHEVVGNDEFRLSLELSDKCGSDVQELDDKKKISNSVWFYNVTVDNFVWIANISCLYVREKNVQIVHETHKQIPNEDKSRWVDVFLHLYPNYLFSNSTNLSLSPFPALKVPQAAYVEIKYQPQLAFHNEIQVETCYAAYSSNFCNNHTFIDNRCPELKDKSVKILQNDETKFRWQFSMFRWLNVQVQQFYLVCSFSRCKFNSTEKCTPKNQTCNSTSSQSSEADFKLSFGPYFVDDHHLTFEGKRHHEVDENSTDDTRSPNIPDLDDPYTSQSNQVQKTAIIAGVASGTFFLIAVIAIGCVMKKRCHLIYGPRFNIREDRIQPGFAFVLRSSNDVPLVNFENDATPNQTSYNTLS